MATTKNATTKKIATTTPHKGTMAKTPAVKSRKANKKASTNEVENLKTQLVDVTNKYGELLAQITNLQIQKERLLGQVLLGLYAIGIGPNEILAMCQKVFKPVEKRSAPQS